MHYILVAFEAGVYYTESDVNTAIQGRNPFDIDHAQLRRMMVDYASLYSAASGTRYRRAHGYLVHLGPVYSRHSAVPQRWRGSLRRAD